jgi:hypothetical protein
MQRQKGISRSLFRRDFALLSNECLEKQYIKMLENSEKKSILI